MLLSKVIENVPGILLSDGEFGSIAFATEEKQENFLTFLEKEKFLDALNNRHISCVLTTRELAERIPKHIRGIFICESPKATLFEIHNVLSANEEYTGKSFATRIGTNCRISPLSDIAPNNVIIGDGVTIEPFVTIRGNVTIGDHVTIRSHAVIGGKGFSFSKDVKRNNCSVTDTAKIIIGNYAEIFEHTVISTGLFPWEQTVIGENTKIDAQCHVGHGAYIGKNCLLAEGCRCCGNSRIGDNVWIGVSAVVSNRVEIGSDARISIGSVVTKNVSEGETVTGNFAIPHQRFLQNLKESIKEQNV